MGSQGRQPRGRRPDLAQRQARFFSPDAANRIEYLELGLRAVVGSESHNAAIQLARLTLGSDSEANKSDDR